MTTVELSPSEIERLKDAAHAVLDDNKAEDIKIINLAGKTDIADYMIVASATSGRHAAALADHVKRFLKQDTTGIIPSIEGDPPGDWVLVDVGCIIIHIFRPEIRGYYRLENMWETPALAPKRVNDAAQA